MLQKIILVIASVFSLIASSVAPATLLGRDGGDAGEGLTPAVPGAVQEPIFTKGYAAGVRFAKVSVLSVTMDGRDVLEDAWGSGSVKELTFRVGTKPAEGRTLSLGGRDVDLSPTDAITVRNFRGKFEVKGAGTALATLALDGTVETTFVAARETLGQIRTQVLTEGAARPFATPVPSRIDLATIDLQGGGELDTVTWETGRSARLLTWSPEGADAGSEAGAVLAKWVKIDGKVVSQYTWGDGTLGRLEFEPTSQSTLGALVNWSGAEHALTPGAAVVVEGFVGSWLVFEAVGGGMKLRLDGYAQRFNLTDATFAFPPRGEKPIPAITWFPTNPTTTDYVTFQDASTDPDGLVVLREWTFGDTNQTSVLPEVRHRFTRAGVWEVRIEVTDNSLGSATTRVLVPVGNSPPVADFEYAPTDLYSGDEARFQDLSYDIDEPNGPVSRVWNFSDGTPDLTGPVVAHAFAKPGAYVVRLTVTDAAGDSAVRSKTVDVRNRPPLPSFTFTPTTPSSLDEIAFTDASTDRDGAITCWQWDFGDGTASVVADPRKTYAAPGSYLVNLTVCDDFGARASTAVTMTVANLAPVSAFSYTPTTGIQTTTDVAFTDASTDADGRVVEWSWNFGDGSPVDTRRNPTHRYLAAGTFNTCLTVKDDRGTAGGSCRSVPVANSAPTARFTFTPAQPVPQQSVAFTDSSFDVDGDAIVEWNWTFGDGTAHALERNPVHRFAAKGVYAVTLTVKDAGGRTGFKTQTLTVVNDLPTIAFTHTPAEPTTVQDATFTATAGDSDGTVVLITWDFGDSTPTATGSPVVHRFAAPGTYTVKATATDNDGATRTAERRVTVRSAGASPDFSATPAVPKPGEQVQFQNLTNANDVTIVSTTWSFGDGTTSTQSSPTHTYPTAGTRTVRLTVRDSTGKDYVKEKQLRVNAPPIAGFSASATSVPIGATVRFTDSSSDPDAPAGATLTYAWDFGDGSGPVTGKGPHDHLYVEPGNHLVRLTVTDADGASTTATRTVSVTDRAPNADFAVATPVPRENSPTQFTDLSTDPDAPHDSVEAWAWDFGDGGASTDRHASHSFFASGLHEVQLTASDGMKTGSITKTVRVTSDSPVTVRVCTALPGDRLLNASLSSVGFYANLTPPAGFGGALGITKRDSRVAVDAAGCVRVTLAATEWAEEDRLTFKIVMFGTGLADTGFADLRDEDRLVPRTLELAMPLVPSLKVANGTRDPVVEVVPVNAPRNFPTYVDQTEPVRVTGKITWLDGPNASGVEVRFWLRYIGLRALQGFPDWVNTPVHGYCEAASPATTDGNGQYTATLRFEPHCLAIMGADGAFLPGWYQVYAVADCPSCDPRPTEGRTAPALFYEDPLGVMTGRVGFPDPL